MTPTRIAGGFFLTTFDGEKGNITGGRFLMTGFAANFIKEILFKGRN